MLLWSSPEFQHISRLLTGFEVTGLRQHAGFMFHSFIVSIRMWVSWPSPVFPIWESFSVVDSAAGLTFSPSPDSHSWFILNLFLKIMLSSNVFLPLLVKVWGTDCDPETTLGDQLKPNPAPLGLCAARIGSVMPLPSGPRPMPGLQPMLCSIRLPMLVSGMGGALSPTNPERKVEG